MSWRRAGPWRRSCASSSPVRARGRWLADVVDPVVVGALLALGSFHFSRDPWEWSRRGDAEHAAAAAERRAGLVGVSSETRLAAERQHVERVSCSTPYKNLEDGMAVGSLGAKGTPEAQLRSFIEKFDPTDQRLIRSVRSAVRKRCPTANELVYDYDNFSVIGYSPVAKACWWSASGMLGPHNNSMQRTALRATADA